MTTFPSLLAVRLGLVTQFWPMEFGLEVAQAIAGSTLKYPVPCSLLSLTLS